MKFLSTLILIAIFPLFGITQCQDSIYLSGHTLHAGTSGMNYLWYSNCTATGPGQEVLCQFRVQRVKPLHQPTS